MMFVQTLDGANFTTPIVMAFFWASWCGVCRMITPEYERAASILSKYDGLVMLARVDADQETNIELLTKYEVLSLPMIVAFREGEVVDKLIAFQEADSIVEFVESLVRPESSAEIFTSVKGNKKNEDTAAPPKVKPQAKRHSNDNLLREKLHASVA